jgi:hypothetical protein
MVELVLTHDTINEVDDFLEHFGVPGMKWGRRKASYNDTAGGGSSRMTGTPTAQGPTRGEKYLNSTKNAGSQKKAIAKTVGKTLAINYVLNAASKTAAITLKDHPSARKGAQAALALLGVANTVSGIQKTASIHNAAKKRDKK